MEAYRKVLSGEPDSPFTVPAVKVRTANLEADLADLVNLNCRGVSTWRHYDKDARPGRSAPWSELSRWERWRHGGPWLDPELLTFHLRVMREAAGIILVAREGESLVGELELVFAADDAEGSRAHLLRMVVDPAWRRRGIGSLLLKNSLRVGRGRGCHKITTYPEDAAAHAFYERQGFRKATCIGEFTKQLVKSSNPDRSDSVQAIRLTWDSRPHPPNGFRLVIGDNYGSRYTWTYLRQMSSLYVLLHREAPLPNLWLLRQDDAEALTVDHEQVRLWLSPQGCAATDFLPTALTRTEQLSRANSVSRLTATAFSPQFRLLEEEGYTLQKEYPYLVLPL